MISLSMSPWKNTVFDLGVIEERGNSELARVKPEEVGAAPSPSVKGSIGSELLEMSGLGIGESKGKKGLFTENECNIECSYCCKHSNPERGENRSEHQGPSPLPS